MRSLVFLLVPSLVAVVSFGGCGGDDDDAEIPDAVKIKAKETVDCSAKTEEDCTGLCAWSTVTSKAGECKSDCSKTTMKMDCEGCAFKQKCTNQY
jgi:hypothetical protein